MVVGFTTTCAISAYHHWSCEFEPRLWRVVLNTTLCDKVCQWLGTGPWFSLGTSVSSTNKTDHHDITEILLKVALNTINQPKPTQLRCIILTLGPTRLWIAPNAACLAEKRQVLILYSVDWNEWISNLLYDLPLMRQACWSSHSVCILTIVNSLLYIEYQFSWVPLVQSTYQLQA
jgi:hypothetical protein